MVAGFARPARAAANIRQNAAADAASKRATAAATAGGASIALLETALLETARTEIVLLNY